MTSQAGALRQHVDRLRRRTASLSIFSRIAIGNSLIIFIGAVGGTLIIHFSTERGLELVSILLFALAGIVVSIIVNLLIIRAALNPLLELRKAVEGLNSRQLQEIPVTLKNPDRDTTQFAAALSELIQQLDDSNQQLRILSNRAIHAQEAERKRIARSLHDETGQALLSLLLTLESIEKHLPEEDLETQGTIAEARQVASLALENLRRIMRDLRPAMLDDLGLVPAIRWYARSNLEDSGIQVNIYSESETLPLPAELNTALFRIAQEAINNILRHSRAKHAIINLELEDDEVSMDIHDDGVGFRVARDNSEAIRLRHWGLVGIRERVALVNGSFSLNSDPIKGTRMQVRVPLHAIQEANDE